MTTGLWALILSTDFVSKGVLLILLAVSIACWALAFYKHMEIKAKLKTLLRAKSLLPNTKGMDDFLARISVIQTTYAGELIATFLGDFKKLLRAYESDSHEVADRDWYLLQSSIHQRVDEAVSQEESLLPILSTSAAGAPLIGLFGTVWGLIHAFMAIAEQRTADIAAVAPGIAEALLTTLGGILVAVPALVLYAYLLSQVRVLEQEIADLADKSLWIMRGIVSKNRFKPVPRSTVTSPAKELQ